MNGVERWNKRIIAYLLLLLIKFFSPILGSDLYEEIFKRMNFDS